MLRDFRSRRCHRDPDMEPDLAAFILTIRASHPFGPAAEPARRRRRPGPDSRSPVAPVRATIRRFTPYARRYRRQIVVLGVLRVLQPLAEIASIWSFKLAVDRVFTPADLDRAPGVLVLLTISSAAVAALSYADTVVGQWVSGRVLLDARRDLLDHLMAMSPDFYDTHPLGDILTRLSTDVGAVDTLVVSVGRDVYGHIVRAIALGSIVVLLSWRLALAAAAIGPLFTWLSRYFARRTRLTARERGRASGRLGATAEDIVANVPLIQACGTMGDELDHFADRGRALAAANLASARVRGRYQPAVDGLELLGAFAVIWLGTIELAASRMTLGELFVFMAFLNQFFSPIRALGRLGTTLHSAAAGAERVLAVLDTPRDDDSTAGARLIAPIGFVNFSNVSFSYPGADELALDNVSLDLRPGKVVAIVGPSGAGKSTVIRLLMRWYEPSAGQIRFDGVDVSTLRTDDLRNQIAFVSQDSPMLDRTIGENIAYGTSHATAEQIASAAAAAGAASFIANLPDGYGARVGPRGRRLSGGQRQRLAIARALLRRSSVLVLDEPTSSLDASSSEVLHEPIERLMRDRATLIVSHNLRLVHHADEIIVLDHGRVVERGTHGELRALDGLYEELFVASLPERPRRRVERHDDSGSPTSGHLGCAA